MPFSDTAYKQKYKIQTPQANINTDKQKKRLKRYQQNIIQPAQGLDISSENRCKYKKRTILAKWLTKQPQKIQ